MSLFINVTSYLQNASKEKVTFEYKKQLMKFLHFFFFCLKWECLPEKCITFSENKIFATLHTDQLIRLLDFWFLGISSSSKFCRYKNWPQLQKTKLN